MAVDLTVMVYNKNNFNLTAYGEFLYIFSVGVCGLIKNSFLI